MKNILNKLGMEGNFLNLIKHIYKIPIVNIIYNYEDLKLTPLLSGTRQRLSPVLLSSVEEKTQVFRNKSTPITWKTSPPHLEPVLFEYAMRGHLMNSP